MIDPQPVAVLDSRGELTEDAVCLLGYFAKLYAVRRGLEREDLFQEAALLTFRQAGRYDPDRGSLANWIHNAVRGAVVKVRGRRRIVAGELLTDDSPGREPDPAAAAELVELQTAIRLAVDTLPAVRRLEVVRRFGLDGNPPAGFKELAGTATRAATAFRVNRAVGSLAGAMRAYGE